MPPKRGQKPYTQTRSKKRKTTSGISESTPSVPMDADLQINTQPPSAIDYDKLALAISNTLPQPMKSMQLQR